MSRAYFLPGRDDPMQWKPQSAGGCCEVSGKVKWATSVDAAMAKANLGRGGRVYLCPSCACWHVTRS